MTNDRELFESALLASGSLGGTVRSTCCFCGTQHFAAGDPGCFEAGELDELRAAVQRKEKVEEHHYTAITVVEFGGRHMVVDCECGWQDRISIS